MRHRLPFFLCALLASAAQAGVVIESIERDARSGQTLGTQRLLTQGGAARIERSAGKTDSSYVIFRDDVLYVVEPAQRRYTAMDRKTVETMAGTMSAAMKEMRAQLAKMPPDQRAMMEQMMGKMGGGAATRAPPAPLQARDLGRSDKAAGRSCRLWELTRSGVVEQQLCVVPFSDVPGKEDLLALSKRMASLMRAMSDAMPAFGGSSQDVEAMESVKGYPVLMRDYDGGKPSGREIVLQSWKEQALPAAQFEVPANFRKQDPLKDLGR
jgi:hypothetical protein